MRRSTAVFIAFCTLLLIPYAASADWMQNGLSASSATNDQTDPQVCPDGTGGAIVVWEDYRAGNADIYAQRIDGNGNVMWTPDGVPIRTDGGYDIDPVIVSDGVGGAFIAWESLSGAMRVGVQHIDSDGNALWTAGGVVLHATVSNSAHISIVTDGAGGAIVSWVDTRSGIWHPYTQRVDSGGTPQWTADGVQMCNAAIGQLNLVSVSDGNGGVICAWGDNRTSVDYDIYAQRVDASGGTVWTADGVALSTAANTQNYPGIASDGQGGAIVAWEDASGVNEDVFVQRISYDGTPLWIGANGVQMTAVTSSISYVRVVTDEANGAIVVWRDGRNGNQDIWAQRLDYAGNFLWPVNGEPVCTESSFQFDVEATPDGAGGVLVCWTDQRYLASYDVMAQRIDGTGAPVWTTDGVVVSTAADDQTWSAVTSDEMGGAVVAFASGTNPNIDCYAQRIERNGYWGYPSATVLSANDVIGDQGGHVNLEWDASRLDPWPAQEIVDYTIWRSISMPTAAALLDAGAMLVGEFDNVKPGKKSVIRAQATASGSAYWQLIDSQVANSLTQYSKVVETTGDSTSAGASTNYFQVIANSATDFWVSNSIGGYSVDNLAPSAPLALVANRVGYDVKLTWEPSTAADFSHYAVYRSESSGVEPVLINFITNAADTMLLDTDASPALQYYYIVTAVDEHENESTQSNEAMVDLVTAAGDRTPTYEKLTLLSNMPNPFGASGTTIRFGLPEASKVSVEFYDIAGRRVALRRLGAGAGENMIHFDGRGNNGRPLPSGVYFYRVTGARETVHGKLSIVR